MNTQEEPKIIDEDELIAAQDEADKEAVESTEEKKDVPEKKQDSGKRIMILKKPINYMGTEYKELHFDFDKLTGKDSLEVEAEIEKTTNVIVITPSLNLEYLIRISARACSEPISRDDILNMNLSDFNHIRSMARNFMLRSER